MRAKKYLEFLLLAMGAVAANASDYYVATNGDDGGAGSLADPFATIQHAADQMVAGDTCFVRSGNYHEEIVLSNYVGSAASPFTFQNYNNEQPVIDGTIPVSGNWTLETLNGHPVYTTTVGQDIWQLFVDGRMQVVARWPNATVGHPCDPILLKANGQDPVAGSWWDIGTWGQMLSAWNAGGDLTVDTAYHDLGAEGLSFEGGSIILNFHSESQFSRNITQHTAGSNSLTHEPVVNPWDKGSGPFLIEHLNALDLPGEWWYDKTTGKVYLMPEDGQDPTGKNIRGKAINYGLTMVGSSYVTLKGIEFFGCTVEAPNQSNFTFDDCVFSYPTWFPRVLGEHTYNVVNGQSRMQPLGTGTTRLTDGVNYTVKNCTFEYSDAMIDLDGGLNNVVENNLFHHFSFTGMASFMLNMNSNEGGVQRRNTFHTNGSKVMSKHSRCDVEYSRAYWFGYFQSDGTAWQCKGGNGAGGGSDGVRRTHNWHHDALKSGARWDGNSGINGTDDHFVSWNVQASLMVKGDYHNTHNNTAIFANDPTDNMIKVLGDTGDPLQIRNANSHTYNNLADSISADRSGYTPLNGFEASNWNGYDHPDPSDTADKQLRDPANLDFRPRATSVLIDQGVVVAGINDDFVGAAPDIGAYEFDCTNYWIPGCQTAEAGTPVPPNGSATVKPDADLMWLEGIDALSHDIYFGTNSGSLVFMTNQVNNIFEPGSLSVGKTYYWRIDEVTPTGTVTGAEWSFTPAAPFATAFTNLYPVADTYGRKTKPDNNYGSSTSLSIASYSDGSKDRAGYIMFDVNVTGTVVSAQLKLYNSSSSTAGGIGAYAMSDTSWTETGLTYNNRPVIDGALLAQQDIMSGTWSTFNVTDGVTTTNGLVSFGLQRLLVSSIRGVDSRESANSPALVVEYADQAVDLPPATPQNLTATGLPVQVVLDWDDNTESDLAGYHVYRTDYIEDAFVQLTGSPLTSSTYTDNNVLAGQIYYYKIRAVDQAGQLSAGTPYASVVPTTPQGNTAPTFNSDPVVEINATEDAAYSSTLADNAFDADSDPLTFSSISGPAWLNVASSGALSGTPVNADVGLNSWMIQVTDGTDSDTATLEITVDNVNDAPTFTVDPINKPNGLENAAYSDTIAGSATDVDAGDTLTYSKVSGPAWLSVAANGALSGTPGAGDVGANVFTVKVEDAALASATATLNITVDQANQPPAFTSNPITEIDANEGVAYGSTIADNASDPESDPMTFSKVSGPAWLSVAANGVLSGTPGAGDVGANAFTVQVDATGGSDTATLNISVIAAPVNQPPAFTVNPFSKANGTENAAYSASIAADASDPESDPLTFSKVGGPAWLSVASDGTLSGTPGAGDVGLNAFTVQVDATGGSDTATLNIMVDAAVVNWTVLDAQDFESGWGIWNDNGRDCRKSANDSAFAHGGTYCVRLRDNTNTSRTTTDNMDLTPYTEVKIEFWFDSNGMAAGDYFDVKLRDASNKYQKVATLVSGTDFNDGTMTFMSIVVPSSQVSFDIDSRVRFECEAPSNSNKIYLDDIEIAAK